MSGVVRFFCLVVLQLRFDTHLTRRHWDISLLLLAFIYRALDIALHHTNDRSGKKCLDSYFLVCYSRATGPRLNNRILPISETVLPNGIHVFGFAFTEWLAFSFVHYITMMAKGNLSIRIRQAAPRTGRGHRRTPVVHRMDSCVPRPSVCAALQKNTKKQNNHTS